MDNILEPIYGSMHTMTYRIHYIQLNSDVIQMSANSRRRLNDGLARSENQDFYDGYADLS